MNKMRAMAVLAAVLTLLAVSVFCGTKAHAQTRTTNAPLLVGQNQGVKVVTVWSRINTVTMRESYSYDFLDEEGNPLSVVSTMDNGNSIEVVKGWGSLGSRSISTFTLSAKRDPTFGSIKFQSEFIASQVVFKVVDKMTGKVLGAYGVGAEPVTGQKFLLQAVNKSATETGFVVSNEQAVSASIRLELFDQGGRFLSASSIQVAPEKKEMFFLSRLFPGLAVADGTVEVTANSTISVAGFGKDGDVFYGIQVFPGRE